MTKQTKTLGSCFHCLSQTQTEKLNIYTEHQVWHHAHTNPIIRALLLAWCTVIWVSCPQRERETTWQRTVSYYLHYNCVSSGPP